MGGMGVVYRAFDERLERRVALKQIRAEGTGGPQARRRFMREARAAARLNHSTVVQVHDVFEVAGCDWLVMEYVEGESLARRLESGPLHPDEVLVLALDLVAGLGAAHTAGIVHRDLKAANVMIVGEGHAKILDFGVAKRLWQEEEEESLTEKGQMVGTPRSMSPEQAKGRQVDSRSDLFSLGTLLYEAITGISPFRGANPMETVSRVCSYRQPPVCRSRPAIPQGLCDLIDGLLEKNPRHRPQTARDVERTLRSIAGAVAGESAAGGSDTDTVKPVEPTPGGQVYLSAERRQVTVLSTALVSSSGEALAAETLFEVLPGFRALVSRTIKDYEGHIGHLDDRMLDHQLVAYFGYHRARGDDTRRAVYAALRLVTRVHHLEVGPPGPAGPPADRPQELAVSIGIHTGPAVGAADPKEEHRVTLGKTLDLAMAARGQARPNDVVVSSPTQALVEGFFELEALPPPQGWDVEAPSTLYRIVEAKAVHGRVASAVAPPPLVGRKEESEQLFDCFQKALEGNGQVVLLSGEAGVGKSRLVRALKEQPSPAATSWLLAYGSPHTQSSPLYPIADLLRRMLDYRTEDTPATGLTRLEEFLRQYDLDLAELVPLLAPVLALPLDERYPPFVSSAERQRKRSLEALLALLLKMAEQEPLVLVVEDLHWLDSSTLELLDQLLDQAGDVSLLVLLTFRPHFEVPRRHRAYLTSIHLPRLTAEEVGLGIDGLTTDVFPAEVREQLVAKADGIPLFVEELTKVEGSAARRTANAPRTKRSLWSERQGGGLAGRRLGA